MALITCTECGKEYSDKASACINCGCPTEVNIPPPQQEPEQTDIQNSLEVEPQSFTPEPKVKNEQAVQEASEIETNQTSKVNPWLFWGSIAAVALTIVIHSNRERPDDSGQLSARVRDDICKSYIGEVTDQNLLLLTTIKNEDARFSLVSINTDGTKIDYACNFFNKGTSIVWSILDNGKERGWIEEDIATIEHRRKFNVAKLNGKGFNLEVPTYYAIEPTKTTKKQTFTHPLLESGANAPRGVQETPEVIPQMVRLIQLTGYKCDSISTIREMVFTRGFEVVCNNFFYEYEIEDKGGNWVVTLQ
ncbi:TPA: zinc ribbon domain-containing protein [Vibrio parahaemolyticus]|uniref:zinc ribbon domain-containing protein n=2 Tax=Vibrionaceae TaxID=641 RepID=UPI00062BF9E8|nr:MULTISPECIES: zinc ribbon domain-containing protein [Vibrio harveyi group]MBE3799216.1 zinc ribbon domain-containing protein [Vibrio parahaemolyticus]MBE3826978.1 zinc ribbon domain-containing protein [Vibrio parahaemolyticus]MBE3982446.1 zinc ribbon domain-containing protein [Vibrio parahaemolyticus]MDF5226533.1 zinc ribbon domain-containing protein [Vibrio parahaemolyticus]MDG2594116.1 zinc ribbon domain-containing protein [Vibrio parahaemolyticus]